MTEAPHIPLTSHHRIEAEAFQKDIPDAVVKLLATGHFALETHLEEIVTAMREFLAGHSR